MSEWKWRAGEAKTRDSKRRKEGITAPHTEIALNRLLPLRIALPGLLGSQIGCAPVVDVAGVYFPGWLVSAVAGFTFAYVTVLVLGRAARTRELGQSGLFFLALAVGIALTVRLLCFSGF